MKKFTPLLILLIFLIGVVWMVFGMKNAMDITSHKKVNPLETSTKEK